MVKHLSPEWLDLLRTAGADLPERSGATAQLQHVVSGTPDGEVAYRLSLVDGRVVDAAAGRDDEAADVTLLVSNADAVAIAKGDLRLEVGYMQGRVKTTGDVGRFLAVQPVLQSADYTAALASVAAATDF